VKVKLYPFFNVRPRCGVWSTQRPGRFLAGKRKPVPFVEAGRSPGPPWTIAENLAPIGIRFPNPPVRSESLYRLSYPDPLSHLIAKLTISIQIAANDTKYNFKVKLIQ
jgi:hypothetical protein